jgi:hypothetical protein
MTDPVILSDGHTYQRSAITQHLKTYLSSPITKQSVTGILTPNLSLKSLIDQYVADNNIVCNYTLQEMMDDNNILSTTHLTNITEADFNYISKYYFGNDYNKILKLLTIIFSCPTLSNYTEQINIREMFITSLFSKVNISNDLKLNYVNLLNHKNQTSYFSFHRRQDQISFIREKYKEINNFDNFLNLVVDPNICNQELFNYYENKLGNLIIKLFYEPKRINIDVKKYAMLYKNELIENIKRIRYYENILDLEFILQLLGKNIYDLILNYPTCTFETKESADWIIQRINNFNEKTLKTFHPILIKWPELLINLDPVLMESLKTCVLTMNSPNLTKWLKLNMVKDIDLINNNNLDIYHYNTKILFEHITNNNITLSSRVINSIIKVTNYGNPAFNNVLIKHMELKIELSNKSILLLIKMRNLKINELLKTNYGTITSEILLNRYIDILDDLLLKDESCKIKIGENVLRNDVWCDTCQDKVAMNINNSVHCSNCVTGGSWVMLEGNELFEHNDPEQYLQILTELREALGIQKIE